MVSLPFLCLDGAGAVESLSDFGAAFDLEADMTRFGALCRHYARHGREARSQLKGSVQVDVASGDPCLWAPPEAWAATSHCTSTDRLFVPDGIIQVFASSLGDSQDDFMTSSTHPSFGRVRPGAQLMFGVVLTFDFTPPTGCFPAGPTDSVDPPSLQRAGPDSTGFNLGRVISSDSTAADSYSVAPNVSTHAALNLISATHSIAFTMDGDGRRLTQAEIVAGGVSEAPAGVLVDYPTLGTNGHGTADVRITMGKRKGSTIPFGSVAVDTSGVRQVSHGFMVRRCVCSEDSSGTPSETPANQSLLYPDYDQDGF